MRDERRRAVNASPQALSVGLEGIAAIRGFKSRLDAVVKDGMEDWDPKGSSSKRLAAASDVLHAFARRFYKLFGRGIIQAGVHSPDAGNQVVNI
jgi:hypothetical protein